MVKVRIAERHPTARNVKVNSKVLLNVLINYGWIVISTYSEVEQERKLAEFYMKRVLKGSLLLLVILYTSIA